MSRRTTIWAMLETVAQRGSTAVIVFLLALTTAPEDLGFYNAALLALSAYQVVFDMSVRQIGFTVYRNAAAFGALATTMRRVAFVASPLLAIYVVVVGASNGLPALVVAALTPIALWPVLASWAAPHLIALQVTQQWARVARLRGSTTLVALAVIVPATLLSGSMVWGAIFLPAVELMVWLRIRSHTPAASPPTSKASSAWLSHLMETVVYQLLGWIRSQSERVVLLVAGSLSTLGLYSLAMAVSRAPVDALIGGVLNHHRALLSAVADADSAKPLIVSAVKRGAAAVFLTSLAAIGVGAVLPIILGGEWAAAALAIPPLAITAPASVIAWVLGATLVHFADQRRGWITQAVGIALGAAAGVVLAADLLAGSLAIAAREIIVSIVAMLVSRRYITPRFWAVTIVLGLVTLTLLAMYTVWAWPKAH